jgi:hypothetical protein
MKACIKNVLLLFFLVINTTLIFSSPANPEEWCFVAHTNKFYYFVESESVIIRHNNITFWILKQSIETGQILFKKRFVINCEDETIAVRDIIRFTREGSVKEAVSYGHKLKWDEILPKTRLVQNILCSDDEPRENIKEYLKKPFN